MDRLRRNGDERRHAGLTQGAFEQGQGAIDDRTDRDRRQRLLAAAGEAAQGLGDRADPVGQRDDADQRAVGIRRLGALEEGAGVLGIGP